ncbi:MAG: hypothetical protein OXU78_10735, partial [Deltaproteobacteria bacterium]|nr:hypothetical protein [Deltaproteobacteria bacterium]
MLKAAAGALNVKFHVLGIQLPKQFLGGDSALRLDGVSRIKSRPGILAELKIGFPVDSRSDDFPAKPACNADLPPELKPPCGIKCALVSIEQCLFVGKEPF